MAYNLEHVERFGKTFVFVTRGKSKRFSSEEVEAFFERYGMPMLTEEDTSFEIPNVKMFSVDLRSGLKFCANKYGTTIDAVKEKATEIFPHLSLEQLTK